MNNSINWFEIPTHDMDRAVRFYEQTLGVTLEREVFGGMPHAIFPVSAEDRGVTGAIVTAPHLAPTRGGVVIYLEAPDGVEVTLGRARAAGADVVIPHTSIGENGWIAVIADPEGNQVGIHSRTRP
ncbi:MAG: VOC family protein [Kofleriaceae bacterium]|nr:VOC family protein [Myxococcales bacterium]MCB9560055.1 VOC family protein [Kofleriaceae bacterium]MCB9571892.1 VOC family protein [Kofleriaceae bacterium]